MTETETRQMPETLCIKLNAMRDGGESVVRKGLMALLIVLDRQAREFGVGKHGEFFEQFSSSESCAGYSPEEWLVAKCRGFCPSENLDNRLLTMEAMNGELLSATIDWFQSQLRMLREAFDEAAKDLKTQRTAIRIAAEYEGLYADAENFLVLLGRDDAAETTLGHRRLLVDHRFTNLFQGADEVIEILHAFSFGALRFAEKRTGDEATMLKRLSSKASRYAGLWREWEKRPDYFVLPDKDIVYWTIVCLELAAKGVWDAKVKGELRHHASTDLKLDAERLVELLGQQCPDDQSRACRYLDSIKEMMDTPDTE